ncbi:hypothetical protein SDRG_12748 [Saprolegnia diclina VS20]|uniref:Uncharacterized protein n=1 Tax=Saprolegnia diclina (strain VS20) TaxID=1156394 RepID=T0PVJ1_SAPDV|nr:hypothetical protein SDRG_12748 [Saprolegnia diclina VS20]EQC29499.1 hypothetical protein SDRG_12748 [Saprolegnia diclina VS20]|eukprot:XP_008617051.1 hypothetical protein SDRG_12748 [Saprolegnia diclina VS20]
MSNIFQHLLERQVRPTSQLSLYEHGSVLRPARLRRHVAVHKAAAVAELTLGGNMVFCRTDDGACFAIHGHTTACMNLSPSERVRSIYYNPLNASIVLTATWDKDVTDELHCRSVSHRHALRKTPSPGVGLFVGESLRWPGFVEFDEANSKILTASTPDMRYKLWDLRTYALLYTLDNAVPMREVKTSPGMLLAQWDTPRVASRLAPSLSVLDIDTGQVIVHLAPAMRRQRIVLIELFDNMLVYKQEHEHLHVLNVTTSKCVVIPATRHVPVSGFAFVSTAKIFLVIDLMASVRVYSISGSLLSTFHETPGSVHHVVADNVIVSCVPVAGTLRLPYVHIERPAGGAELRVRPSHLRDMAAQRATILLSTLPTCLAYDADSGDVYAGDAHGTVSVWSTWT